MQSLHDCYWSIHNDVTPPTTRRVPITLSSICSLKYSHRALLGEQSVVHFVTYTQMHCIMI